MQRITTTLDFTLPDNVTKENFEEWFKYQIGWGSCYCDNPLSDNDINDFISNYKVW